MRAIRAHDGASWDLTEEVDSIHKLEDLQVLLSKLLLISSSSLILMHTQGWQIDQSSLPLLLEACRKATPSGSGEVINRSGDVSSPLDDRRRATATSSTDVYCFDREHLDADPDELESELVLSPSSFLKEGVLPTLSSGISPKALGHKHLRTSRTHLESVQSLLSCLSLQRSSLSVALSNLDRHRNAKKGAAEAFELFASPLLSSYGRLLATYSPSLALVQKIKILPVMLASASATDSQLPSKKDRTLGDYISREKFDSVYSNCSKTYAGMIGAFTQLNNLLSAVADGGEELLMEFAAGNLDDLEDCEKDSLDSVKRVEELCKGLEEAPDKEAEQDMCSELAVLETESRERLLYLVARKNAATRSVIGSLQHIALLQSDLSATPVLIKQLDTDLKLRCDSFKHLSRLQDMVPAYVGTIVELLRRKTFSRLFSTQANDITAALLKIVASENKKRSIYRNELGGRLPWEIKGLDSPADSAEVQLKRSSTSSGEFTELPDLALADVEDLRRVLTDLLDSLSPEDFILPEEAVHPLVQAKSLLEDQLIKLESMEKDFSRFITSKSSTSVDSTAVSNALENQIRSLEDAKYAAERELQNERSARESEVAELSMRNADMAAKLCKASSERSGMLERESRLLAELDGEKLTRRKAAETETGVREELRKAQEQSAEVEEQSGKLQAELQQVSSERDSLSDRLKGSEDALKRLQQDLVQEQRSCSDQIDILEQKCAKAEDELLSARKLSDELQAAAGTKADRQDQLISTLQEQLATAQHEQTSLQQELEQTEQALSDRDDQLKQSAISTTDLQQRLASKEEKSISIQKAFADYRVEAELDRAGLEEQLEQVRKLESDAREECEARLEQLDQVQEHVRQSAAQCEALKQQLSSLHSDSTSQLSASEENARAMQKAFSMVKSVLDQHNEIIQALQPKSDSTSISAKGFDPALDALDVSAASIDQYKTHLADSSSRLQDAINSKSAEHSVSLRKWQKECKGYRERSKQATAASAEKIAFRNFCPGDLALFLPTRNTTAQVWAAFNAGFPHYFLKPKAQVAEQIKSREWLVARISHIDEKVVDPANPQTNPYGLGMGTKYWLLETEAWTPSGRYGSARKKSTSAPQPHAQNGESANDSPHFKSSPPSPAIDRKAISVPSTPNAHVPGAVPQIAAPAPSTSPAMPLQPARFQSSTPKASPSNLSRSLASAPQPLPTLSPPKPMIRSDQVADEADDGQAASVLSTSPAFLPSNPTLKTSTRSTSPALSRHAKPQAYRPKSSISGTYHSISPSNSAGFTHIRAPNSRSEISASKVDRRKSYADSRSSAASETAPMPLQASRATLASSFVSSLGNSRMSTGQDAGTSPKARDLLKRFSESVESSTGSGFFVKH